MFYFHYYNLLHRGLAFNLHGNQYKNMVNKNKWLINKTADLLVFERPKNFERYFECS